ncbi:539_t:CDS:2, partial [Cetraspora pellucida]
YIEVTATWLSSDFNFYKALLTCNVLDHPHTDNGVNMMKSVHLLKNSLSLIEKQLCTAYTLQLSIYESLKQYK